MQYKVDEMFNTWPYFLYKYAGLLPFKETSDFCIISFVASVAGLSVICLLYVLSTLFYFIMSTYIRDLWALAIIFMSNTLGMVSIVLVHEFQVFWHRRRFEIVFIEIGLPKLNVCHSFLMFGLLIFNVLELRKMTSFSFVRFVDHSSYLAVLTIDAFIIGEFSDIVDALSYRLRQVALSLRRGMQYSLLYKHSRLLDMGKLITQLYGVQLHMSIVVWFMNSILQMYSIYYIIEKTNGSSTAIADAIVRTLLRFIPLFSLTHVCERAKYQVCEKFQFRFFEIIRIDGFNCTLSK